MAEITIPPEVISALRGGTCCGCNKCLSKALRDALKAWQTPTHKMIVGAALDEVGGTYPAIILPLPQEALDE